MRIPSIVLAFTASASAQMAFPPQEFHSIAPIKPDIIVSDPLENIPFVAFDPDRKELVRLYKGGCIRGPFTVNNSRGEVIFRLDAGADIPDGCSK